MSSSSVQAMIKLTIKTCDPKGDFLEIMLETPMVEYYIQDNEEQFDIRQAWVLVKLQAGLVTEASGTDTLEAWPDLFDLDKRHSGYSVSPMMRRLLAVALVHWKKEN